MSLLTPVEQLDVYGPEHCEVLATEQARVWCRRLALGRYENFSVLNGFVPRDRRDDFAAVYAFCRWADDLGDAVGDRARSLELLSWWRRELEQCYAGAPRHPVFLALRPTIERFELPRGLFDDLIRAFEQDQHVSRYDTWDQVIDYCRLSANPVGRLVLLLLDERAEDALEHSDRICTALQLTNHWQDIKRDILERDRIYVPREMISIDRFEERLRASAARGHAVDRTFLGEARTLVRALVDRTWPYYEFVEPLCASVGRTARPVVWVLAEGGQRVLRLIELWAYETVLHRPRLSPLAKLGILARAYLRLRFSRFRPHRTGQGMTVDRGGEDGP